jgi:hypothetical protein
MGFLLTRCLAPSACAVFGNFELLLQVPGMAARSRAASGELPALDHGFFLILPENVGTYFAPQCRFLPECSTPLCIRGVGRQTHALFGFVVIPIQDRHEVRLRPSG